MSHPTGVRGLKHNGAFVKKVVNGSHPTGVRGLKLTIGLVKLVLQMVAPHGGAWIETVLWFHVPSLSLSHPTGVRGLKHGYGLQGKFAVQSHPTGVRGLKHQCRSNGFLRPGRTPRGCVD